MKKQTNLHSIKLLSLAMVAAITIIIGATISISAQDKPTFKVGDRVEALPSGTKWVKGTIVNIHLNFGEVNAIEVRVDNEKDYTSAQRVYTTHVNNVRPLTETAAEKQTQAAKQVIADKNVLKLRVDENNTVLADRELLDCPVEQKPVKKERDPIRCFSGNSFAVFGKSPRAQGWTVQ